MKHRQTMTNVLPMAARQLMVLFAAGLMSIHAAWGTPDSARQNMENQGNPLVQISTDRGDIFVELFPRAAPRNVERFLELMQPSADDDEPPYYDGTRFHRIVSNHFIQAGRRNDEELAHPSPVIPHEINAQRLGLGDQRVIDDRGRPHEWLNLEDHQDFQKRVLTPLYQQMNIQNESVLRSRQDEVMQRLRQLTLQQLLELKGYRYDTTYSSRMPLAGSLLMVPYGPEGNSAEFFISLLDAPWLMGKNTVIGQVVAGQDTIQRIHQAGAGNTTIRQIRQTRDNSPSP